MQKIFLLLFLHVFFFNCNSQNKTLSVGDTVPSFVLKDQDGKDFDVKDYIGKKILVIY